MPPIDSRLLAAAARAWPARWLVLLNPLPGGGVMDACGMWHGFVAANDE